MRPILTTAESTAAPRSRPQPPRRWHGHRQPSAPPMTSQSRDHWPQRTGGASPSPASVDCRRWPGRPPGRPAHFAQRIATAVAHADVGGGICRAVSRSASRCSGGPVRGCAASVPIADRLPSRWLGHGALTNRADPPGGRATGNEPAARTCSPSAPLAVLLGWPPGSIGSLLCACLPRRALVEPSTVVATGASHIEYGTSRVDECARRSGRIRAAGFAGCPRG